MSDEAYEKYNHVPAGFFVSKSIQDYYLYINYSK